MSKISDHELIEELKGRFVENKRILEEQRELTKQLQTLNRKLEDSEALKSHFLSNIKNEINNPLASILALSSNIYTLTHLDPEQVKHTAELIHKEAFSLDFQLRNIFSAAEMEAGDFSPSIVLVEVDSLLDAVISSFGHLIKSKDLKVSLVNNLEKGKRIISDAGKLQLILSNLLHNAIEFSERGREIVVKVDLDDTSQFHVAIIDQGVGIPKVNRQEIFDRFKQLDTGTTKSHLGHGLGLSVVKALVEILDGKIQLESEEGKGTKFEIVIPQSEEGVVAEDFSSDGNEFLFNADEEF